MRKEIKILICMLFVFLPFFAKAENSPDSRLISIMTMGNASAATGEQALPIEVWNDYILIKANVDGIDGLFIWDTGYSISAIDSDDFTKLSKDDSLFSLTAKDGTGENMQQELRRANEVSFIGVKINNTAFSKVDFKSMPELQGKIKGIIGASIIRKLNWKFNFDNNTVIISTNVFKEKGIDIPFIYDDYNMSALQLNINAASDYIAIDTGNNRDGFVLPKSALPLFNNSLKAITKGFQSIGVSRVAAITESYTIKDFNYSMGDKKIALPVKTVVTLMEGDIIPTVGNTFFRHYNPVFNNTNGSIILTPRKTPYIENSQRKSYGSLFGLLEGKVIVVSQTTNPNTLKNPNLKIMDEVASLNNIPAIRFVKDLNLREYIIGTINKNEFLTVKKTTGEEFTLYPEYNIYK